MPNLFRGSVVDFVYHAIFLSWPHLKACQARQAEHGPFYVNVSNGDGLLAGIVPKFSQQAPLASLGQVEDGRTVGIRYTLGIFLKNIKISSLQS